MTVAAMQAHSRPYIAVDILNDLFAPLVLEIDVDVGQFAPLQGEMKRSNGQIGASPN